MQVPKGEGKPAEKEGANTNSNTKYYQVLPTTYQRKVKVKVTYQRKKGSQQRRKAPITTPRVTKALCSFRADYGEILRNKIESKDIFWCLDRNHNAEGNKCFVLLESGLREEITAIFKLNKQFRLNVNRKKVGNCLNVQRSRRHTFLQEEFSRFFSFIPGAQLAITKN